MEFRNEREKVKIGFGFWGGRLSDTGIWLLPLERRFMVVRGDVCAVEIGF